MNKNLLRIFVQFSQNADYPCYKTFSLYKSAFRMRNAMNQKFCLDDNVSNINLTESK